jgi:hypothetical protein
MKEGGESAADAASAAAPADEEQPLVSEKAPTEK